MFLIMGFGILFVWGPLMSTLCSASIYLLFLGGVTYISGIVFFILGEYHPIYHCIWHLFVVLAAAFHWFDVYLFIVRTELGEAAVAAGVIMMEKLEAPGGLSHMIQEQLTL